MLSEGFYNAKVLGKRLAVLFETASQLLSKQQHYDWGLRALKSVVGLSAQILLDQDGGSSLPSGEERQEEGAQRDARDDRRHHDKHHQIRLMKKETSVLIRAVYESTVPKLTAEDTVQFQRLVRDSFPGNDQVCMIAAFSYPIYGPAH